MLLIKYIVHVYETAKFNYYSRMIYGSDIGLFDQCSWKSYKENC
jgi:hypothetical protein